MVEKSLHAEGQEVVKNSLYQAKQGLSNKRISAYGFADFDMLRYGGSLSLGKEERLSSELLLNKLFSEGKSVSQNGFALVYLKTELSVFYPAQAAFSVPKKVFKRAVDRNTIKRQLREAYRHHKPLLYQKLVDKQHQLALMLIYKGRVIPEHIHVQGQVSELLSKLIAKL